MEQIAPEKLDKLEADALQSMKNKDNLQRYILARPDDILVLINELKELRSLNHDEVLTAAYMAGTADANKATQEAEKPFDGEKFNAAFKAALDNHPIQWLLPEE